MNPSPKYDILQQTFSLNWLSNIVSDQTGSQPQLQAQATAAINRVLADPSVIALIGAYETVWGPVVYQYPGGDGQPASTVADNVMYVAKTTTATGTRYVVAVAYTNPISWYDWLVEDLAVSQMVAWPGVPGAMISAGANTGLGILLNMTSSGQSLVAFLNQVTQGPDGKEIEVVTCGHSLGGTLSPLVALTLAELQGEPSGWDQNRCAVVSAVPSAGFSPGNLAFADYYESMIGLRTTRLWNNLDMVPASYNPDSVRHIPYLYYPYIVPNTLVRLNCELSLAMAAASGQTYVQYNRNMPPLAGQVQLGVASFSFNLSADARAKFSAWIAQTVTTKLGIPAEVAPVVEKLVGALISEFLARWTGSGATSELLGAAHAAAHATRGALDRTVQKLVPSLGNLIAELEGMIVFYAEALVQHLVAYPQLLGVTEFVALMQSVSASLKPTAPAQPTIVTLPGGRVPAQLGALTDTQHRV